MGSFESKFEEGPKKDKDPVLPGNQKRDVGEFKKDLNNSELLINKPGAYSESLTPEDKDLYDNYRYSAVNQMEDALRHIQKEKGQEISKEESLGIQEFIYGSVFFSEGQPGVPPKADEKYHLFEINYHAGKTVEEARKMDEIFTDKKSGKIPDFVYVQTDENTQNPAQIIKYSYLNFISSILPHIQKNALGSYIITDGRSTTVTFLDNGVAYWSKHEKSQKTSLPASEKTDNS